MAANTADTHQRVYEYTERSYGEIDVNQYLCNFIAVIAVSVINRPPIP